MNKLTRVLPLLCVAAVSAIPAQAQELKIGFLAPRTGIITQLGTDMNFGRRQCFRVLSTAQGSL